MKQYADLGRRILDKGELRHDRTGTGTLSVFGANLSFDLRERFPLITIKQTRWKVAFLEMLWFLRGDYGTDWLNKHDCKLWDAWADEHGYLGPIYGVQWRRWPSYEYGNYHDQVKGMIHALINNPHGRRHLVSAWNVANLNEMALPPCHWAHQCYVSNDKHLDLKLFLRSSDFALGLPFNIAQYALLTHLYARAAGLTARHLIVDIGDAHMYTNHVDTMQGVLLQQPIPDHASLRFLTNNTDIDGYRPEDFIVDGYDPHPFVSLPVAV